MNECIEFGRLVKDPDVRYAQNGKAVTGFIVAVTRDYKNRQGKYDADYIPCVAFDKKAELIGNNFGKGDKILVKGSLRTEHWQDKKTGQNKSALRLYVDDFNFVENKQQTQQGDGFSAMGTEIPMDDLDNY